MDLAHRNYLAARKRETLDLEEWTFSLPLGAVAELAEIARRQPTTVARLCSDVAARELLELDPTLAPFTDVQRDLLPTEVWDDSLMPEGIVRIVFLRRTLPPSPFGRGKSHGPSGKLW